MNITDDQKRVITKYDSNVQIEGPLRLLSKLLITAVFSMLAGIILHLFTSVGLEKIVIISILQGLIFYVYVQLSDHGYMMLYRQFKTLKKTAMEIVRSNHIDRPCAAETLLSMKTRQHVDNSRFIRRKIGQSDDSNFSRDHYNTN
ncbi:MAG: hypothetical protein ABW104_16180 [Candidatus Thiodiazotropha sp. 6PLUC2]